MCNIQCLTPKKIGLHIGPRLSLPFAYAFCLRRGRDGLAYSIREFDFKYSRAEADDAKRFKYETHTHQKRN